MCHRIAGAVRTVLTPIAKRALPAREYLETGANYDLTSLAAMADPYVLYVDLRQKDPIRRMRLINASAMTDYEDVEAVLLYHKLFPSGENKLVFAPWRTTLVLDPPRSHAPACAGLQSLYAQSRSRAQPAHRRDRRRAP